MSIELRDYDNADIETLVSLANNERVSRYLIDTFPYPYTRTDAEFWISSGSKQNGAVTKVICKDGAFVGSVGLTPQTGWRSHCAEVGYWLAEDYWGQGIAAKALELITDYAFEHCGFKKLFAPVLAPNSASMRVLEKCGYALEGVLKHEVVKNGKYYDIHQYAKSCL
jgi:RimJ/RimL family protein N-acetyltransferase